MIKRRVKTLLKDNGVEEIEEIEVGENDNGRVYGFNSVWEWIAKSMMTGGEFMTLKKELLVHGIDMTRIDNADYLELEKEKVNKSFKKAFGKKGPNAKGLVVLSQKCDGVTVDDVRLGQGCHWRDYFGWSKESDVSSCFYVGDVDISGIKSNNVLRLFLSNQRFENTLLFMQIPHHGSKSNVRACFENDYPAKYYFVNDKDTKRLQNNLMLYNKITKHGQLLVSRAMPQDMIVSETKIRE